MRETKFSIWKSSKQFLSIISRKEVKHNCPSRKCGLCTVTSFPEYSMEKRGGTFTVEKPDRYYIWQMMKLTQPVTNEHLM